MYSPAPQNGPKTTLEQLSFFPLPFKERFMIVSLQTFIFVGLVGMAASASSNNIHFLRLLLSFGVLLHLTTAVAVSATVPGKNRRIYAFANEIGENLKIPALVSWLSVQVSQKIKKRRQAYLFFIPEKVSSETNEAKLDFY